MFPCLTPDESDESDERPNLPARFRGGCHCGKVKFLVTVRGWRASACNCSICTMKGFLHVIVPSADFELLTPGSALTTYTFNTGTAKHHFCSSCGVHSFYVPRSHPDGFSVNAHCIEDAELAWFDVEAFDGRDWEAHVARIR
ncbi:MAG TPA: GFA family protein [Polyangiaceae bacterium]|nr:GFA family protein [Polyangiaceae bacterium]